MAFFYFSVLQKGQQNVKFISIRKVPTGPNGIFITGDGSTERVDPVKFFQQHSIDTKTALLKELFKRKDPIMTAPVLETWYVNEDQKAWEERLQSMEDAPLAESFLQLFESKGKMSKKSC